MDEKRKAASTNVYQGETEAVEGTGKVNISDVELHLNDRKGIRKEDKKRHICKELGRSGSFFFFATILELGSATVRSCHTGEGKAK